MPLDDDLRALAAVQYAVVSREQARALGATTPALRNRLAGPDWDAPTKRVLRLTGSAPSTRQRLMIAVLDAGAGSVVSHRSAAALWRLPGFSFGSGRIEVSRHRALSHRKGPSASVHRPRLLPATHVTDWSGLPVTTLARTLLDIAPTLHPARLERVLDTVSSKSPSVLTSLRTMLWETETHGREGVAALRPILAARPEGYVPTASGLEARFARLLDEAGEAPLERQVDIGGHEWVGRVDFLDRALGLVVEVDSDLHHTSPMDRAHDRQRDAALLAAGWTAVLRISEDEIWRRPQEAVARVRAERRRLSFVLVSESDRQRSISGTRSGMASSN